MAYPQKLLSDGETVVHEMRPHWRSLVFPAFWLIVIAGAGAFVAGKVDGTAALDRAGHRAGAAGLAGA